MNSKKGSEEVKTGKASFFDKTFFQTLGKFDQRASRNKVLAIAIAAIMMVSVMTALMPATVAQHGPEGNTLRVYGEDGLDAAFPYTDPEAPFDPTNAQQVPQKDFVTFNPAFMYHFKTDFFRRAIVADGTDASEKVFLRQWYVPEYKEPAGEVWVYMSPDDYESSSDIVNEYTYMLTTADGGKPRKTSPSAIGSASFVFPIADNDDDQKGLDSYDVNNDGESDRVLIYDSPFDLMQDYDEYDGIIDVLDLRTGTMKIEKGEEIQFLDFKAVVKTITENTVVIETWYQGNDEPDAPKEVTIDVQDLPQTIIVGRHSVQVKDIPIPVDEPGYFEITSVDPLSTPPAVHIAAGRLISYGETFFVDCVEYDVAMIHGYEKTFKYITIRNPLPKEPVRIEKLTIDKCPVAIDEKLPMLPPFNDVHDVIDDINVTHDYAELESNLELAIMTDLDGDGDLDGVDVNGDGDMTDRYTIDELIAMPMPDGFVAWPYTVGDIHVRARDDNTDYFVNDTLDTVMERRVEDQPALNIKYTAETNETRFHTNLLEIYDDIDGMTTDIEDWKWLHTWTKPNNYTEFIYPVEVLMTSSFTAPNSGGNRLKFVYNATENSNGIYVNVTGVVAEEPWYCDWTGDGVITNEEISMAEWHWATGSPKNEHTITNAEISMLEYMWATGDIPADWLIGC